MVALRRSYRPPRSTPPLMNGVGLEVRARTWTSATSKAGTGAAACPRTATEPRMASNRPANARNMGCSLVGTLLGSAHLRHEHHWRTPERNFLIARIEHG